MQLLAKDQLAAHVNGFPGIAPERKSEIASHLTALPPDHIKAVRDVLERSGQDPESQFVRGCFGELTELPPADQAAPQPGNITSMPTATENPELPPAA